MTKKNKQSYTINRRDAHMIRHCLEYCQHRMAKHTRSGLSKIVELNYLKEMIKRLL